MFNTKVVGAANALAAGWVSVLLLPLLLLSGLAASMRLQLSSRGACTPE
jgi:hypothetical protein